MSKKSDVVTRILQKVELDSPLPTPLDEASLIEQGLHAILLRRLEPKLAEASLRKLRASYPDWNELRVAQGQEIADLLQVGERGLAVARDVKAYLQEIYQGSHGLDLEFLRDDPQTTARFVSQLPFMGMGVAHYLMWLADGRELPVTPGLVRVLDRMGVMGRTGSPKKARAALAPMVSEDQRLQFAVVVGEVATRWCDPRKPLCQLCALVDDCKHGRKAFKDWKVQQERLEVQRVRDEARQAVLQKKEDARRVREAERERKKAEVEAKKAARNAARNAQLEARHKASVEKRAQAQRARDDERRKRDEERAAAKAAAEAKKQQVAKAKAAASKKAAKKPTRSGSAAGRAGAKARKSGARQAPKAAAKRPATKSGRKPATRSGRKSATKSGTRKGATRKGATRKGRSR